MEAFAEQMAKEKGLRIVEISLRATNVDKGHLMMYQAGVEEFLSLIKNAEVVVTNSFHGIIMSVLFHKLFYGFSREQCDNKTAELSDLLGLSHRMLVTGNEIIANEINFEDVHRIIKSARETSLSFLKKALDCLINEH